MVISASDKLSGLILTIAPSAIGPDSRIFLYFISMSKEILIASVGIAILLSTWVLNRQRIARCGSVSAHISLIHVLTTRHGYDSFFFYSQWLYKNWFESAHDSKSIFEIWFKSTHDSKSFQNILIQTNSRPKNFPEFSFKSAHDSKKLSGILIRIKS